MHMFIKKLFFSSLLIFQISIASQEQEASFFYDERNNTEWILGKQLFSKLVVDAPTKNYVFFGEFSSDADINVKAKNLIIIGSLISTNNIGLKTTNDFFNAGFIKCKDLSIVSDHNIYNGLNTEAIRRIQALGIDISFANNENHTLLTIVKPASTKRIMKPASIN